MAPSAEEFSGSLSRRLTSLAQPTPEVGGKSMRRPSYHATQLIDSALTLHCGLTSFPWTNSPTTPCIKPTEAPEDGANLHSEAHNRVYVFADDADPIPDEYNILLMSLTPQTDVYMSGAVNDVSGMTMSSPLLSGQEPPDPDPERGRCEQEEAPATDNDRDNFVAAALPSFRGQTEHSPGLDLVPCKQDKASSAERVQSPAGQSLLATYLSDCSPKHPMSALDAAIDRLVPKLGRISEQYPLILPSLDVGNKQSLDGIRCPTCGKPSSNNEQDSFKTTSSTTESIKRGSTIDQELSHADTPVAQLEDLTLPVISPLENLVDTVMREVSLSTRSQEADPTTILLESKQWTNDPQSSFDFGLGDLFPENGSRNEIEEDEGFGEESDLSSELPDWFTEYSTPASGGSRKDGHRDSTEDFWEGGAPEYWD